jgi:hypothetical protein
LQISLSRVLSALHFSSNALGEAEGRSFGVPGAGTQTLMLSARLSNATTSLTRARPLRFPRLRRAAPGSAYYCRIKSLFGAAACRKRSHSPYLPPAAHVSQSGKMCKSSCVWLHLIAGQAGEVKLWPGSFANCFCCVQRDYSLNKPFCSTQRTLLLTSGCAIQLQLKQNVQPRHFCI